VPPSRVAASEIGFGYQRSGRCRIGGQDNRVGGGLDAGILRSLHGFRIHRDAFSHLVVDDEASNDHVLVVHVTPRLSWTWGVPVRAEFSCPDTRTIVMRIVDGEGSGSVVETHATPLGVDAEGRPLTMVTEATIAYSDRPAFPLARWMAPVIKPGMRRTARKLWIDDLAYAERRYELRQRGEFPG
jgi:hypothetical protein